MITQTHAAVSYNAAYKETVQWVQMQMRLFSTRYTSRKTPVFVCYLDLSKAFDLVSYDMLWRKLQCDTDLTLDVPTDYF